MENEIVIVDKNEVVPVQQQSPVNVMMIAIEKGLDLDKIEKMMELQERFEANEAKKSFVVAMAGFKKVPLIITKDKENKQYNSRYTSIGNIVNTALPAMSSHGLSHKWDIQQSELIKVTCIVTHAMGHSESVSMEAPADKSGAKNAIQQIKSTITYLKLATFESMMGLASSDKDADDDGNGSEIVYIDDKQLSAVIDMLNSKFTDYTPFLKWLKIERPEQITQAQYDNVIKEIERAKEC